MFVNDGSNDKTLNCLYECLETEKSWCSITILDLSRNFGKEAALIAGLDHVDTDACIVMDADLQHPPQLLSKMVWSWLNTDAEMISASRQISTRANISKFTASKLFYRVFRFMSKLDITLNSSDFRLLDRKVVDSIRRCRESVRFSKGFFAWSGFKNLIVYYEQPDRFRGVPKWGSWRLWNYGLDGIFNFSTAPLRIWSYLGLLVTLVSFCLGTSTILSALLKGADVPGYPSIFVAVTFLGGIQLIGIGILGEYLGRIFIETKHRPLYLIRSIKKS